MLNLGIKTGADLKKYSQKELVDYFGKAGNYYYHAAHGREERPVRPDRERKSYGKETTLATDIDDTHQMLDILAGLAESVVNGLRRKDYQGLTLTLKVKYHDFQSVTRSVTFSEPIGDIDVIMENVKRLLENTAAGDKKVRLLGISVSNFLGGGKAANGWVQMPLPFRDDG